jgi:hypothetical protein
MISTKRPDFKIPPRPAHDERVRLLAEVEKALEPVVPGARNRWRLAREWLAERPGRPS